MSINQLIEGHYKNLVNKGNDLMEKRMAICRDCKLYKEDAVLGGMCNKKLYLNPKTNETSIVKKEGFYKGCGCMLRAKTRLEDAKCPIKKW